MNIQGKSGKGAVSVLENRIEKAKAAHAYLSRKTRDLAKLSRNLQSECNTLKNQLAPVLSLPDELLGVIFEALSSDIILMSDSPPIQISLSHVSRRFRHIAMSTRRLWTRIEVSLYTPFDMIISYLQRSRSFPFDLRFDIDANQGSDSSSDSEFESDVSLYTDAEWKTIMSYMIYCRRFSARSNDPIVITDIIDRLHTVKAPLLQSFQIGCYDVNVDIRHYLASRRNIIDGGAPALTFIRIDGWSLYQCLPPLSRVTSLTLLGALQLMQWIDFRNMVGNHLALTRLVIGSIFSDPYIPQYFESTIVLSSLKSLHIYIDDNAIADQILLAISASALEFLTLGNVIEQDLMNIFEHPQLRNPDRFPYLRYLNISLSYDGPPIGREAWTSFCSLFPCITHFTVRLCADEPCTLEPFMVALGFSIMAPSPGPHILPKLHTLSFYQKKSQKNIVMLRNLVSNRAAAGQPLSLLQLPTAILHDEDFANSLIWLREHVEVREYQAEALEGDDGGI